MKKPLCELIGADGNIFNLMSIACKTLKENDLSEKADELKQRLFSGEAESYDRALQIILEYVEPQ